jgi:hypothetical protein
MPKPRDLPAPRHVATAVQVAAACLLGVTMIASASAPQPRAAVEPSQEDRAGAGLPDAPENGRDPDLACVLVSVESGLDPVRRIRAWARTCDGPSLVAMAMGRVRGPRCGWDAGKRWLHLLLGDEVLCEEALGSVARWLDERPESPLRAHAVLALAESEARGARDLALDVFRGDLQAVVPSAEPLRASILSQMVDGLANVDAPEVAQLLTETYFELHRCASDAHARSRELMDSPVARNLDSVYDARLRDELFSQLLARVASAATECPAQQSGSVLHHVLFHGAVRPTYLTEIRMRVAWRAQLGDCKPSIHATWGWWFASARGRIGVSDAEQAAAFTIIGAAAPEGVSPLLNLWRDSEDKEWRQYAMAGLCDAIWVGHVDDTQATELLEQFGEFVKKETVTEGQVLARLIRAYAARDDTEPIEPLLTRVAWHLDVSARAILAESVPWEVWSDDPKQLLDLLSGWPDWSDADVVDRRCEAAWRRLVERAFAEASDEELEFVIACGTADSSWTRFATRPTCRRRSGSLSSSASAGRAARGTSTSASRNSLRPWGPRTSRARSRRRIRRTKSSLGPCASEPPADWRRIPRRRSMRSPVSKDSWGTRTAPPAPMGWSRCW